MKFLSRRSILKSLGLLTGIGSLVTLFNNCSPFQASTNEFGQSELGSKGDLSDQFSIQNLSFDAATPHQISLRCLQTRVPAVGTSAQVFYRVQGETTWTDGGFLQQVKASEGATISDEGFAGYVLDLNPATIYELRVDFNEPEVGSWSLTNTQRTRSLPLENTVPTKTCNPASFAAVMSGAVPGDVIVLDNGTYDLNAFHWTSPGTPANTVYIRGQSQAGVILENTTGLLLLLSGGYVVLENMTLRGSKVDSDVAATSMAIAMSGLRKSNITIRHLIFDGFDRAIKAFDPVDGLLVYDCEFKGNNTHAVLVNSDNTGAGWNDDGVGMPGQGNCVWNCTFSGHGDVVKLGDQSHLERSRACYMHNCWVKWSSDDGFEFDNAGGNVAAYNNIICNTTTAFSADEQFGGPIGVVRNLFINQSRHPMKLTGLSQGVRVHNNTFVSTNKTTVDQNYGMRIPNATNHGLDFKNNLLTYRGSGDLIFGNGLLPGLKVLNNAWYPNRSMQWTGGGTYTGENHIFIPLNPFVTAITLGSDYTTLYNGQLNATLAAGSGALAQGVKIPGVTDGFTGPAPDVGAFISGRSFGVIGCAWDNVSF